ncbi:hypothetical protein [Moorena sp. SIO2C4]|uniref:hypothetical protein n=1 Tax=Moorena sp. SIO2C4 TaxID=2607824 RepID=UPI0013C0B1BF|nr:hypothetical protein [Moorena sp. SIO2C4]NEQ15721.1 hypothetical protein [Moorena sp. SIO3E2]NES45446.1 hypothetical protein [Moorena sp. SIO2C4]
MPVLHKMPVPRLMPILKNSYNHSIIKQPQFLNHLVSIQRSALSKIFNQPLVKEYFVFN